MHLDRNIEVSNHSRLLQFRDIYENKHNIDSFLYAFVDSIPLVLSTALTILVYNPIKI